MSIISKILGAFHRGNRALESAVTKFDTYVERQKQVQSATIDMISGYQLERRYIDIAWASAERELAIQREYGSDPHRRERFEEIRAELEAKFEDMPKRPESKEAADYVCADLRPPARHPNPEIATAIEQKHSETAAEYSALLSDVLRRLERQRELRSHFEDRLIGLGGSQILGRLKALETGREWRYIAPAVPNEERAAPKGGVVRGQIVAPLLGTLVPKGDAVAKSSDTSGSSVDVLDAYIRRAKDRKRTPAETNLTKTLLEMGTAQNALINSDQDSSSLADSRGQRDRATFHTSQSKPLHIATDAKFSDRRSEIMDIVAAKRIPSLFHFTRKSNLESILKHGLVSLSGTSEMNIKPHINDSLRLDGYPNAVSLSVAFPNDRMFYKYRQSEPKGDWVVLSINPAVLWQNDCAFCERNAADHRIRTRPLLDLTKVDAFRRMFDAVDGVASREEQRLMDYDPTDPQAEVLVFGLISPQEIGGVGFDNKKALDEFAPLLGGKPSRVYRPGGGLFGARTSARKATN